MAVASAPSSLTPVVGNIADSLTAMARDRPDAMAVFAPAGRDRAGRARHVHLTFRQLDDLSDFAAIALTSRGICDGARTVLMVRPGLAFFALVFGLFKAGAVPVLVDPGLGIRNIGPILAEAAPAAFVGIPAAHVARRLFGWGKASIRSTLAVAPAWPRGWKTLTYFDLDFGDADPGRVEWGALARNGDDRDPYFAARLPDETAAILFTSGSTGVPKGVVYTHAIFRAQVELLRATYGIEPGEVDLCTFPLFALFAPALGMTSVVPAMDFTRPGRVDPRVIVEAVRDFGATNLFGSPALIRRVGEYGEAHGIKLPSLRRAISAGAPVPAKVLASFATMLNPEVEVFTPYGATESLPVASIGSATILGETRAKTEVGQGVCVGHPVAGMEVAIIAIKDGPISAWSDSLRVLDGRIGEIAVAGPVVTRSYYARPEATALAKIRDGDRTWHRMGDVGYLDEQGRIWFCGRKAHRVVAPDRTLFTIPVEGVFNTHPHVARSALVGVGPAGAQRPVVCVEDRPPGSGNWPFSSVARELAALAEAHDVTRGIDTFLRYPGSFPVDIRHNAKIFREKIAAWAARRVR